MQRVALLGTGTMGGGMAANLLKAGLSVRVWNRSRERTAPLAVLGATVAATPGEAAEGAAVVIAMVADDDASRTVWLGDTGALAVVAPGTILIESSTLTGDWVRELAFAAREREGHLLDAPVTGSRSHAAEGQLLFLVGGDAASLDRARPVFAAMGRGVVHLGEVGSATLMKLINNFLVGVQTASLAEAVALIERSALDRSQAVDLLLGGAVGSPLLKTLAQRMASPPHETHFAIALMRKDLEYALHEAETFGLDLTTARSALAAFQRAEQCGLGGRDMSAVVEPLRR